MSWDEGKDRISKAHFSPEKNHVFIDIWKFEEHFISWKFVKHISDILQYASNIDKMLLLKNQIWRLFRIHSKSISQLPSYPVSEEVLHSY